MFLLYEVPAVLFIRGTSYGPSCCHIQKKQHRPIPPLSRICRAYARQRRTPFNCPLAYSFGQAGNNSIFGSVYVPAFHKQTRQKLNIASGYRSDDQGRESYQPVVYIITTAGGNPDSSRLCPYLPMRYVQPEGPDETNRVPNWYRTQNVYPKLLYAACLNCLSLLFSLAEIHGNTGCINEINTDGCIHQDSRIYPFGQKHRLH